MPMKYLSAFAIDFNRIYVSVSSQLTSTESNMAVLLSNTTIAKQKEHPAKNEGEMNLNNHNDFSNQRVNSILSDIELATFF